MEIRDDDLAATVIELEGRMSRPDIARALGIGADEVAEIASGYLPEPEIADGLRRLAAVPAAAGPTSRALKVSRLVIVAFVLADLVFFGLVAALVLLR